MGTPIFVLSGEVVTLTCIAMGTVARKAKCKVHEGLTLMSNVDFFDNFGIDVKL